MNENIILSFFPPTHAQEHQIGGLYEETKNIDFYEMANKTQNNRSSLGEG